MIFVIRPEPGLQSTLQGARDMGLAVVGMPLFEVLPLRWPAPDATGFDALLLGSANAVRHGGDALEQYRDLRVHDLVVRHLALSWRKSTGKGGSSCAPCE